MAVTVSVSEDLLRKFMKKAAPIHRLAIKSFKSIYIALDSNHMLNVLKQKLVMVSSINIKVTSFITAWTGL